VKTGDSVNGYELLQDFSVAGQSQWTFARSRRDGNVYFLKQFLSPKYPTDGALGSAVIKQEKLKRCVAFESRHVMLKDKLARYCGMGGNLIAAKDFFRVGPIYYKVTEKVNVSSVSVAQVSALAVESKKLILSTVAHSLRILHDQAEVVHGDLKPDNILIKEMAGKYVAKLIDFDASYLSGAPPDPNELVGDQIYWAPEGAKYLKREVAPGSLGYWSDVFALGLIYTQFLSGHLPTFNRHRFQYPCDAVNSGEALTVDDCRFPKSLTNLLNSMLVARWQDRPRISQVFEAVKSWDLREPASTELKGTLVKELSRAEKERRVGTSLSSDASQLRGTLGGKRRSSA